MSTHPTPSSAYLSGDFGWAQVCMGLLMWGSTVVDSIVTCHVRA